MNSWNKSPKQRYILPTHTVHGNTDLTSANGLIRNFYPKKTDFRELSDKKVADIENNLDNQPRKAFRNKMLMRILHTTI